MDESTRSEGNRFKAQLRDSLQRETLNVRTVKYDRHANIYTCGDHDEMVYFIESGRIKLLMLSPEGKECMLAIHGAGDVFGELCLSGAELRLETATAMEETILKKMPRSQFLARLSRESLFEAYVRYLAMRIAEQQQVIADLVTVDSEQRLGKTLLQLARTLGKQECGGRRIGTKISHDELSEMVGTTRPRISMFMERFRKMGLLGRDSEHFLVVNEGQLTEYLNQRGAGEGGGLRRESYKPQPAACRNVAPVSMA